MKVIYWELKDITLGKLEKVRHLLQAAVNYNGGEMDVDDHFELILDGMEHLLLCLDEGRVVGVTAVQFLENHTARIVLFTGDSLRVIEECSYEFEGWLRASGAVYLDFYGRPGWERFCKKLGFKMQFIVMRKEL